MDFHLVERAIWRYTLQNLLINSNIGNDTDIKLVIVDVHDFYLLDGMGNYKIIFFNNKTPNQKIINYLPGYIVFSLEPFKLSTQVYACRNKVGLVDLNSDEYNKLKHLIFKVGHTLKELNVSEIESLFHTVGNLNPFSIEKDSKEILRWYLLNNYNHFSVEQIEKFLEELCKLNVYTSNKALCLAVSNNILIPIFIQNNSKFRKLFIENNQQEITFYKMRDDILNKVWSAENLSIVLPGELGDDIFYDGKIIKFRINLGDSGPTQCIIKVKTGR